MGEAVDPEDSAVAAASAVDLKVDSAVAAVSAVDLEDLEVSAAVTASVEVDLVAAAALVAVDSLPVVQEVTKGESIDPTFLSSPINKCIDGVNRTPFVRLMAL